MFTRTVLPALAGLALMFGSGEALGDNLAEARPACQEDQACWVWSKMGNHRRGIVSMNGNRRVVGPCMFARLSREGMIDWSSTGYMRGDRYANEHGCEAAHRNY